MIDVAHNQPSAKQIFLRASELPDEAARRAYLAVACDGDSVLRQNVEAMVRAGLRTETNPLDRFGAAFGAAGDFQEERELEPLLPPDPNRLIGPYKLLEPIGRGGFGTVYMAEQMAPVRRMVALKVLNPGMESGHVIVRFEAERQALALMDHPNIARVLDGGTTPDARPYFVMDLVRGAPITDYCDEARLTTEERLRLFVDVCRAVEHAHQKGIVHRDLKPSNVLVTMHDDHAVPKVIDFGIAKALSQQLTDRTLFTGYHQLLGTPMYMSPEQAQMNELGVDPRSDVYSLGVLLYELLTGLPPFDPESIRRAGFDELRRLIRETDPPRPSDRFSTLNAGLASTIADKRSVDQRRFQQHLCGEIDWIVMKAIEKDRNRRYESASALAADVRRYLEDRPVLACPPSWVYRIRKAVRRKRGVIAAITLALVSSLFAATAVVVVRDRDRNEVSHVSVPENGSVTVTTADRVETHVATSRSAPALHPRFSGLIHEPAQLPGVGRWQLISKAPRSFLSHNWKFCWSPDSRFIAFGDGHHVRIYSIPDFELVHVLVGHTNSVVAVDWSPDGELIASASVDNTVRLWDAETGVPGPVLVGHRDRVDTVAWSPDSSTLASGGRDHIVRLWTKDGDTGPVLNGHTEHVYAVAWNPDGTKVASTGADATIRIWDSDGLLQRHFNAPTDQRTIAWSSDGQQLLTISFWPGFAQVWNVDGSLEMTLQAHPDNGGCSATWSPDGRAIITSSHDNTAKIWNSDGTPGPILSGHDGDVYLAKWSPDGRWIATGGSDRSIRLWSPDGQPGPVLSGHRHVASISWDPDGSRFAAGIGDHSIRICDAEGHEERVLKRQSRPVAAVDWSSDGRRIVAGYIDGMIRVWNADEAKVEGEFGVSDAEIRCVSWSPDGCRIVSTSSRTREINIWSPDGATLGAMKSHQHVLYQARWSPLDERLASVSQDGTVRLWNSDGSLDKTLNVGELLASVAWRPDGKQLASGSDSGAIQFWTIDGKPGRILNGHSNRVASLDWSSDGRWLASGGRDQTVRLWSSDGELLRSFYGHTGESHCVKWRPDSTEILSSGNDGTIRLWNAETRRPEWVLVVLPDRGAIKLGADGRRLHGDADRFEQDFAYIVEQPTGAMEIVSPTEFNRRTGGG